MGGHRGRREASHGKRGYCGAGFRDAIEHRLKILATGDKLTCGECVKFAIKDKREPKCFTGPCRNATAHNESTELWIAFVLYLDNAQELGICRELLELADALDPETLDEIIWIRIKWRELKSAQARNEAEQQRALAQATRAR